MKYPIISTCLCGLLLVCLNTKAGARSISSGLNSRHDNDPMMALPSDGQQQSYEQRAPQQEVRYVALQARPGAEHHGPASPQYQEVVIERQAVPASDEPQPVGYTQREQLATYQLVQGAARPSAGLQYSSLESQQPAQVEIVSGATREPATGGEYPGEIVYVESNEGSSDGKSLAAVANSLNQNSGLAATILTEVPVRDMPYEVLEKLKRQYGVKVVATRERPGANLVINCDEHSASRESFVCRKQSRQPQIAHDYHYQTQPVVEYHTLEPAELENQAQGQPQYQYQQQASHVEAHEEPQHRSHFIQVSHEAPVAHGEQVHDYATAAANLEQQQQVRRFSHRGVVEEILEQPAYQLTTPGHEQATGPETHSTTVAVSEAAEHQQPAAEQSEYYGTRTATTPAVSEQAAPVEEVQTRAEAVQAAQVQQASPNNPNESADQQGGFEEQPKQLEGEPNAYRP